MQIKIKDIMTRGVTTVTRATDIKEVIRIFAESAFGSLPVIDDERKVVGIITKKDLLLAFLPDYFDLLGDVSFMEDFGLLEETFSLSEEGVLLVDDIMNKKVVTVEEDASLLKAVASMVQHNIRRLPVVNKEGILVGIITQTHICQAILQKGKEK